MKTDGQPVNLLNVNTADGNADAAALASKLIDKAVTTNTFGDLTGKDNLASLQSETLKTAESARKDALSAAKGMAEKVIEKLPDVIKAKAGVEDKREAEEKKKETEEKKKAADAAKEKALKKSEGIKKMKEGAKSFVLLAGNQSDEEKANAVAKQIVNEIFGDDLPGLSDLAILIESFAIANDDSDNLKRGKKAILTALGLPVPTS